MPAANVPLTIDQGEDFTAQVIWTDDSGAAQKLTTPMRMDIAGAGGQIITSLTTDVPADPNEIPELSYSAEIGLIQIHIPRAQTAALTPGMYQYDMFVTVQGDVYGGAQRHKLLAGDVIVNKRITEI